MLVWMQELRQQEYHILISCLSYILKHPNIYIYIYIYIYNAKNVNKRKPIHNAL